MKQLLHNILIASVVLNLICAPIVVYAMPEPASATQTDKQKAAEKKKKEQEKLKAQKAKEKEKAAKVLDIDEVVKELKEMEGTTDILNEMAQKGVDYMLTAKVFENGRSQAVRLPKECRFSTEEVAVNKIGDIVMLIPKESKWDSFISAIELFSDDYFECGRKDLESEERDKI